MATECNKGWIPGRGKNFPSRHYFQIDREVNTSSSPIGRACRRSFTRSEVVRELRFIHCRYQIPGALPLWYSFDTIVSAMKDVRDINDGEYGNDCDREHERPSHYGL